MVFLIIFLLVLAGWNPVPKVRKAAWFGIFIALIAMVAGLG